MEKEKYWSKYADVFNEKNEYVIGKENLQLVFDKLEEQKHLGNVLEFGCGNGMYTQILAKNTDKITATDLSDEMTAVAKDKLSVYPHILIEKNNCFDSGYPGNSFDTVFAANLLHIIPRQSEALKEFHRVLKKNGRLIIISYTIEGMKLLEIIKMGFRYSKAYGKKSKTASKLTVNSAVKLAEAAGFQITECSLTGNNCKAIFLVARKL